MPEPTKEPNREPDRKARGPRRAPVSGVEFAGLGAVFAITILVGLYAGQWLDRQLGTDPVMTVSGLFVAAAAGFYSMYRRLVTKQRGGSGGGGGRRSNDS